MRWQWGEWENKDIEFQFSGVESDWDEGTDTEKANRASVIELKANSRFSIDDFNVQDDFVGQERTIMIEMEIECEKLLDLNTSTPV